MEQISIVVPCYNEEEALPFCYEELKKIANQFLSLNINLEFIFVDDGSKDKTLEILKKYRDFDNRVHFISFSRNFGKEAAIYAGFKAASGDYVALMDADLQDPPQMLIEMYNYIKNDGYDCVATRRVTRKGEPIIRSFFARMFYKIMSKISNIELVDGARDYRLMKRIVVNAILDVTEYNRFTKGIYGWVGFKTKWLEFENTERVAGQTKWSFWKLFKYSLEGIIGFSTMPLTAVAWIGILMCVIAGFSTIFIILRQLILGGNSFGWPSLICVIMFFCGVQLLCTGIVGQYLAKTYLETKKRPLYIIRESDYEK